MAYADKGASSNKLVSVLLVVLLHVALGFGLIIGLNYEAIKKEIVKTEVFDVEEEVKEEEPPPPPDEALPPPPPEVYVPPAPFTPPTTNRVTTTNQEQERTFTSCPGGAVVPTGTACPDQTSKTKSCPYGPDVPAEEQCRDTRHQCKNGDRVNDASQCAENQRQQCPPGSAQASVGPGEQCRPKGVTTKAKAKGSPGNWVPKSEYPRNALREKREGRTGFSLTIGPNGRPTACSVTSSSGHADLDAAVCPSLMKRAKFDPAMEDGKPTTGTYSNAVTWRIDG